ncbi:MAG TPA: sigma-70 family RNA polymerase sigma factor [Flavobacteriales bacterium]|jgi:RNA polymerase sigma-70 factor (ECF subfamily)|nr:sigma-70 family RNA polymerase sigma factor [Flavobacteriales bacterium]
MEVEPNLSSKAQYDIQLVTRAIEKHDQAAYAELLDRYKESVYYLLLKMVNNKDDAEDLTIEAFGKAFKNIAQYTPNFAFSTWLFRIATNNCIDFIRKKRAVTLSLDRTFTSGDGDEMTMDVRSDSPDPEEHMIRKQKNVFMRSLVDKLKPRYRVLIELRYFQELSYEEIAERLDLPLGTVKAQLFRSREFLYNIIRNSQEKI